MIRQRLLLLLVAVPLSVSPGAFAACSTSEEESLAVAPGGDEDAAMSADVTADGSVTPEPPKPTCTLTDIAPGTGGKFCELPGPEATDLHVPPEFCVREFTTTPIVEARVLRFAPNGDLFVAAPSMTTPGGATDGPGSIMVLPDDDGDGRADSALSYAGPSPRNGSQCATLEGDPKNLACVHGLLFSGGYLYFARSDEVPRLPYAAGQRSVPAAGSELVATPGGSGISDVRWTHTLEQTRSGSIYVSRGRGDTSACTPEEMKRGAVFALHVENAAALPLKPELVADGFRKPMYLRCSPSSCSSRCTASRLRSAVPASSG